MTTSDSSVLGTRVSLCNVDKWQEFYPVNEMAITRDGRKLSPKLRVKIEGLDPNVLYTVSLHMERVNDFKYTFKMSGTGNWEALKPAFQPFSIDKRKHRDGEKVGAHWTKSTVSFTHIDIGSNQTKLQRVSKKDPIYLESMCKYQPVITVHRLDTNCEEEFRLTMTEFIAVSRYQNPKIKKVRKQSNELIKRIPPAEKEKKQPQGKTPRGKKRDNKSNNCISTSQSTVSPSTNTVAQSNKKLVFSRGTWIPPLATPITPSTMVAPPSVPSTLKEPPFGSPNYFQNRMMTSSAAPTQMTSPSWEPNGYQNQAFTPQTSTHSVAMNQFYNQPTGHQNQPLAQTDGTLPNLATPSAHHFSMNQHYQSFEMWNESQIDGVFMPPQHQSNTMPGYNFSQNNAHFGDIANMQMGHDSFPPSPY
ncbi:unnamed protein product [Caenorhabditis brenneri]